MYCYKNRANLAFLATISLLTLMTDLSKAKAAQAESHQAISDSTGTRLNKVKLSCGQQFSEQRRFVCESLSLQYSGPMDLGTLFGEVRDCTIGQRPLDDKRVTLMLNNQKELNVNLASKGFTLSGEVQNPSKLEGAVQCGQAVIFSSSPLKKLLEVSLSGTVWPTPNWRLSSGGSITTADISFAGKIAPGTANTNVDSVATGIRLVSASAYPATVAVVRHSSCKIGSTSISDTYVHILYDGTAVTTNSNISIADSNAHNYALRFAAAGGYGTLSGAVSCTNNGSLTYTY